MKNLTSNILRKTVLREDVLFEDVLQSSYLDLSNSYLWDESRYPASLPEKVVFPKTETEIVSCLKYAAANELSVVLSGGRTGVVGSATAQANSLVLSLDKMNAPLVFEQGAEANTAFIRVPAGVRLFEVLEFLREKHPDCVFPVDPTETSASIGGMLSTNASGARSFRYSSVRKWIDSIRVVLADGSLLSIKRGEGKICNNSIELVDEDGETRVLRMDDIPKPDTKNSIGYCFNEGQDLIDLFIGAEGTLGVISEVTLRLIPRVDNCVCLLQFFRSKESAFSYVEALRETSFKILAIEYFDERSLKLVKNSGCDFDFAAAYLSADFNTAILTEVVLAESKLLEFSEFAESQLGALGESIDNSVVGIEEAQREQIKAFRHAVPESINKIVAERKKIHPEIHKLSTDMAVPHQNFKQYYQMYEKTLAEHQLEFVMFGHIGNSHLHVNLLPRDLAELALATKLYVDFARQVVSMSGSVAAEHGIGRMKKEFLRIQYSQEIITAMKEIKAFFDPQGLINPGVLL